MGVGIKEKHEDTCLKMELEEERKGKRKTKVGWLCFISTLVGYLKAKSCVGNI